MQFDMCGYVKLQIGYQYAAALLRAALTAFCASGWRFDPVLALAASASLAK